MRAVNGVRPTPAAAVGLLAVAAVGLLAGCSLPGQADREADANRAEDQAPPTRQADLEISYDRFNDVYCDGTSRPAAIILGLEPGEPVSFVSPMPVDIPDGMADETGSYVLRWSCQPEETALAWEVTATAQTSGQSVDIRIDASGQAPTTIPKLAFTSSAAPTCSDTRQEVGWIDNLTPNRRVTFESDDADNIASGTASATGRLAVNWQCLPEEAGRSWTITASEDVSGRTVTFTFTATAPEPVAVGPIAVTVEEDPFTCDRERRVVARLSNLTPLIPVEFEAVPSAGTLEPGRADADGELTVFWQCQRSQDGTPWMITATETTGERGEEPRTAVIDFTGAATENPTLVEPIEDPVTCDGTVREVVVIKNFVSGEFVDFSSPDTDSPLRQGQADSQGTLTVRWQCEADDDGREWVVTTSGQTSGLDATFTITGAAP